MEGRIQKIFEHKKNMTNGFVCPNCRKALEKKDGALMCANKHSFDLAREGYVNLLLSNKKNSASPGDNKLMVAARKNFLDKDFYLPLAQKIATIINSFDFYDLKLLDSGCGSGFYLSNIVQSRLDKNGKYLGIDISKEAIKIASKNKLQNMEFAVASSYDLPLADESCNCILSVFSPYALSEFSRVIDRDGRLVVVSSAKRHLWELKKFLYGEDIYEKENKISFEGWKELASSNLAYKIDLQTQEDISNLLSMTPFLYTTGEAQKQKLAKIESLNITVDFDIKVFSKI